MTDIDAGIRFPGESEEYRRERNRLLEAEAGLRRGSSVPTWQRQITLSPAARIAGTSPAVCGSCRITTSPG
jgi:hypothetical protein